MKKNEVEIGGIYVAKISGKLTHVEIKHANLGLRGEHRGWTTVNCNTNKKVFIRSAAKLRGAWKEPQPGSAQYELLKRKAARLEAQKNRLID